MDGQWHHVIITMDGSKRNIYIDGIRTQEDSYSSWNDHPTTIQIGENSADLNALLDELRIYDEALTEAQAQALAELHNP